jgi:nicotinamide mononucleotide (NMN) deamidase PncC
MPVGTAYLGIAIGDRVQSVPLSLSGTRREIQSATVQQALATLLTAVNEYGE